jgi:hypothetical protein
VRADALLFDLGGVVIDIDFGRMFARRAAYAGLPPEAIRAQFSFDALYERHERGEILLLRTLEGRVPFRRLFVSSDLGMRKPEAQAIGMQAVHVIYVQDVANAVRELA